jgi:hypothetical protein
MRMRNRMAENRGFGTNMTLHWHIDTPVKAANVINQRPYSQ